MQGKNFVAVDGGFLQSNLWEKFQNSVGKKTFRINEGGFSCLAIEHQLPIVGKYFFVPRAPILLDENNFNLKKFLKKLKEVAKENSIGWIRLEPQSFEDLELIKKALENEYEIKKSKKNHEPNQTLMLDISGGKEGTLSEMKPKTRYNIRLCQKKGVNIFMSRDEKDIEDFLNLLDETARRDGIKNHPKDYYRKILKNIPSEHMELILAKFDGEIISGALVVFYGEVAVYLHGASSDKMRNLMAPFGVQWKAIELAKEKGCRKYDFGGVSMATEKYPQVKKSWDGITRFKTGFCPKNAPVEFPGCWDVVLSPLRYRLYRIIQILKDIAR